MPRPRGLQPARDRITQRRVELGMSLQDLADKIDRSYQHIANIESGHHPRASVRVLEGIARALRLNLEDVVSGGRPQPVTSRQKAAK